MFKTSTASINNNNNVCISPQGPKKWVWEMVIPGYVSYPVSVKPDNPVSGGYKYGDLIVQAGGPAWG